MKHFLIAGHGYIGQVHEAVAPIRAEYLVRHLPQTDNKTFYTDFDKAMETRPAFLDICTPNDSHKELFEKAARYHLPVYCEKPLAVNLEDATKMLTLANENGIPNGMAFNYRFLPCVHLLKKLIQEKTLGEIIYYKASFLHDSYLLPRPNVWRTSRTAGGGALADLGIHLFDLCRFVFGESRVTECSAHIEFPERTEVDEYARCTLQSGGAKGYLEISRISAGRGQRNGMEVFFHGGSAEILFDKPYEISIYSIEDKITNVITADTALLNTLSFPDKKHDMGMFYGSHKAALTTFVKSIEGGEKSDLLADFGDGAAAQKMLHDALTIAK